MSPTRVRLTARLATATCLATCLATAAALPASAASPALAPAVTASPSTGLSDGATVNVSASGFAGDSNVGVVECAEVQSGQWACNLSDMTQVTLDAGGSGATTKIVHSTFDGRLGDGTAWGTVDCAKIQCTINAGNADGVFGSAPISFA
ncbi:enediyne antibiotic chromoprotein [Actinoallomurus sp. NPDC050550]|uniref:enediyne antibiotic chromoprotein n=1 Tax=Actinoallomurus sp. NPDC050550 TaxID=3154937 RepID=UPI0033F4A15A